MRRIPITSYVIENFADFRRLHPALSTLEIKDMVPSEAVMPIHPGALKYYREAGLSRRLVVLGQGEIVR